MAITLCLYNFVWKPSCDSWTVGSIKPSHWAKAKSPPPSKTHLLYCTRVGSAQWFGLSWDQLVYWRVTADWDKCGQAVPKDINAKSPIPLFISLSLSFETLSVRQLAWALGRTIYRLSDVSPLTFYTSSPFHHLLLTGQDHAARFTSIHERKVDGRYQS